MIYKQLDGRMKVELDVGVCLCGGSVLVTVGEETEGVKLKDLVLELIEANTGRGDVIDEVSARTLRQVQHELVLAASLLSRRLDQEASKRMARGEAL
jgi:hypothetical protein